MRFEVCGIAALAGACCVWQWNVDLGNMAQVRLGGRLALDEAGQAAVSDS